MKYVYTVHFDFKNYKGYYDDTAGIFSSWENATEVALLQCGKNAKELIDPEDEDFNRATDQREFEGDKGIAWIICTLLDKDLYSGEVLEENKL